LKSGGNERVYSWRISRVGGALFRSGGMAPASARSHGTSTSTKDMGTPFAAPLGDGGLPSNGSDNRFIVEPRSAAAGSAAVRDINSSVPVANPASRIGELRPNGPIGGNPSRATKAVVVFVGLVSDDERGRIDVDGSQVVHAAADALAAARPANGEV